jgi:hypothetical protein
MVMTGHGPLVGEPLPRNRRKFPFDPTSPLICVPARRVVFAKPPPSPIALAVDKLIAQETLRNRRHDLAALSQRRRRAPNGTMINFELSRRPRNDFRAAQLRMLAACVERCGLGNGLVGEWTYPVEINGKVGRPRFVRPLSRHQLAAYAGVSLSQADEVISSFKAAWWIGRRQRRRNILDHRGRVIGYTGDVATLVLNDNFWKGLGPRVWNALVKHRELLKLEGPPRHAQEQKPQEQGPPTKQIDARTPEERGWPPDDKPPPTS